MDRPPERYEDLAAWRAELDQVRKRFDDALERFLAAARFHHALSAREARDELDAAMEAEGRLLGLDP